MFPIRSPIRVFQQVCVGLFCMLLLQQGVAQELHVLLLLSGNAEPYERFAASFKQGLPAGVHVTQLEDADVSRSMQKGDLLVTVGSKAGIWASAHTQMPLLAAMLPSREFAQLVSMRGSADDLTAIFVDQPWARQVKLLQAALPDRRRIGLLYSPGFRPDTQQLRKLLAGQGDSLIEETANPSVPLFDSLSIVLSRSDVLLAVPDKDIYNGNNIRNILLSSYRQRVPLVGLSQAYVDAGALCAVFSTPEQLARQAVVVTLSFEHAQRLPRPQFPQFFSVAVNREVALMLDIRMDPADRIQSQIERAEK